MAIAGVITPHGHLVRSIPLQKKKNKVHTIIRCISSAHKNNMFGHKFNTIANIEHGLNFYTVSNTFILYIQEYAHSFTPSHTKANAYARVIINIYIVVVCLKLPLLLPSYKICMQWEKIKTWFHTHTHTRVFNRMDFFACRDLPPHQTTKPFSFLFTFFSIFIYDGLALPLTNIFVYIGGFVVVVVFLFIVMLIVASSIWLYYHWFVTPLPPPTPQRINARR